MGKGKRLALPSSRVMIHQPMGGAQGQAEDIKVEAKQIMKIRDNLVKMYSMMTGRTQDQITKDLDRDNFLSAQEAVEYGLIDRVLEVDGDDDAKTNCVHTGRTQCQGQDEFTSNTVTARLHFVCERYISFYWILACVLNLTSF